MCVVYNMSTRNWRKKNNEGDCNTLSFECTRYHPHTLITQIYADIGTFNWVAPENVREVKYLVVGGGGGGGGAYNAGSAGGGGGGLVISGGVAATTGTIYTIVVGDGGDGGAGDNEENVDSNGSNGDSSRFDIFIASGGGGGKRSSNHNGNPRIGGNAAYGLISPTGGFGTGIFGSGYINNKDYAAGGGGGNITAGGSFSKVPGTGMQGGFGIVNDISGTNLIYGAGGNGGKWGTSSNGSDADATTGNGGGGASSTISDNKDGGKGGSGIVILAYYV